MLPALVLIFILLCPTLADAGIPPTKYQDAGVTDCVGKFTLDFQDGFDVAANGSVCEVDIDSSSIGQWTDAGSILHPNEETVDEVVIGGTTEAGADIFLGVDGAAVFNEQSGATGDFRIESDGDTHIFFVDYSENTIGIGTSTPDFHVDIHHTADETGDISLHIEHDVNSLSGTIGLQIDVVATALASEEEASGIVVSINTANSTGGEIDAFTAVTVGTGSAEPHALRVAAGMEVIEHDSGAIGNVDKCELFDASMSAFTDCKTAANSTSTDVTMFVEDDDIVYIGFTSQFSLITFDLDTGASGGGIKPTFAHSATGDTFVTFGPLDTTSGKHVNETASSLTSTSTQTEFKLFRP